MAQHHSWIVEIGFMQPDGQIKGQYTDERRQENETAATAAEAGEKVVEMYRASAKRSGLLDIKVLSVMKQQIRVRRPLSGSIFPHGSS